MKLKKAGYIMFLLLAIIRLGHTQEADLKFHLIEGPNGKPLGKIKNISQDPNGYMWFAAEDKGTAQSGIGCIYRYDGYRIMVLEHDMNNPNSLGGIGINWVHADSEGMIWIGMGEGLDRYNPATGVFTHYKPDDKDPGSISGGVTVVIKDHQGRLWVGTNKGLDRLDEKTGKFIHYRNEPGNPKSLSSNVVWNLYEDREGVIWVATGFPFFSNNHDTSEDGGLSRLEPDGTFTQFKHDPNDPHSLISNKVKALFEDSQGVFWVGTSGDGLHTMDRKTGRFERHTYNPARPDKLSRPALKSKAVDEFAFINDQITFIQEDVVGSIWIGTMFRGLSRYDTLTKRMTRYEDSNGFPDGTSWNAFQSRDGVLWITTERNNLFRVDPFRKSFRHIVVGSEFVSKGFEDGGTSAIVEDKEGFLWIGTKGKGLFKFDQQQRLIEKFNHEPSDSSSLFNNGVFHLQDQGDTLWIGTTRGLGILNKKTGQFSKFHPNESFTSLDTSRVMSIMDDRQGLKWITTWGNGLFRYNASNGELKQYLPNPQDSGAIRTNIMLEMYEDKSGILWFSSLDGVHRWDSQTDQFKNYLEGNITLSYNEHLGDFLIGTSSGIYQYDQTKDSFSVFDKRDELRARIFNMVRDKNEDLWIATPSYLLKLNKARDQLFSFGNKFGIPAFSLTPGGTMLITKSGQILQGTYDGFIYFTPDELASKTPPAKIIISDFSINSLPVLQGNGSPLKKPIEDLNEIILRYDQSNFSFNFGSDDYRTPKGVRYFTMLENYDPTWREVLSENNASYFFVNPGDYVFRVMIYNNDGVKTEKAIAIRITPPWWKTWWAYGMYGIGFLALVWSTHRYQRQRVIRSEREKAREKELAQAKEIEKAYTDLKATQALLIQSEKMASLGELTAGIAHEIQNPLNFVNNFSEVSNELLDEMNEEIEKGNLDDVKTIASDVKQNLEKVLHHGKRADAIVKGMLQHSRSSRGVKEPTDINALADEYLRLAYHGLRAKDKAFNATLNTDFDESLRPISIIPQEIGRVILNLITNAFYAVTEKKNQQTEATSLPPATLPEGRVLNRVSGYEPTVSVSTKKLGDKVLVSVKDNGNGIPAKVLDKIFQPFFTTKPTGQGTGLGLSLSYDIVKTHGGEIKVNTNENEGTEFTITLPA